VVASLKIDEEHTNKGNSMESNFDKNFAIIEENLARQSIDSMQCFPIKVFFFKFKETDRFDRLFC